MGTDAAGSHGPCGFSCAECPARRSSELCRPGPSETSSGPLAGGRVCVAQLCQSLRPGLGNWGVASLHRGPSVPQVPQFWGPSRTERSHCALCVLLLSTTLYLFLGESFSLIIFTVGALIGLSLARLEKAKNHTI